MVIKNLLTRDRTHNSMEYTSDLRPNDRGIHITGWCKSRGKVLFLSSVETEMTDTIEIGLKIRLQHLHNQK